MEIQRMINMYNIVNKRDQISIKEKEISMVVEKGREEGGDRDDGQSRGEGVEVRK